MKTKSFALVLLLSFTPILSTHAYEDAYDPAMDYEAETMPAEAMDSMDGGDNYMGDAGPPVQTKEFDEYEPQENYDAFETYDGPVESYEDYGSSSEEPDYY